MKEYALIIGRSNYTEFVPIENESASTNPDVPKPNLMNSSTLKKNLSMDKDGYFLRISKSMAINKGIILSIEKSPKGRGYVIDTAMGKFHSTKTYHSKIYAYSKIFNEFKKLNSSKDMKKLGELKQGRLIFLREKPFLVEHIKIEKGLLNEKLQLIVIQVSSRFGPERLTLRIFDGTLMVYSFVGDSVSPYFMVPPILIPKLSINNIIQLEGSEWIVEDVLLNFELNFVYSLKCVNCDNSPIKKILESDLINL